jgi:outer membrane protein TolC
MMLRMAKLLFTPFLLVVLSLFAIGLAQETLGFSQALALSQQSPSVVLAQGQRDLAQKQLDVARGTFSGKFTAGYTQTWGESTATVTDPSNGATSERTTDLNDGSLQPFELSGTFNVVPFGPNADNIQKAQWSLAQAELSLRDAQATAVVNTVQSYLTALRATQEVELKTFSVEVATQQLEANRVRRETGAATDQQVLQAEIALSQAQSELATAQRSSLQALASLSNQLGVIVNAVGNDVPNVTEPNLELDIEKQILERADVQQALTAVQEAELNAASTTRQYLPSGSLNLTFASSDDERQFSASAGYDTQSFQPNASLSFDPSFENPLLQEGAEGSRSTSFSIGIGATVPIESSLAPALEAAELSISQSQQQAEQTQELARLEVTNAQRQLDAARSSLELSQQLVEQSQVTFDNTKERFDLGLIIQLDVLTAEEALKESQLNLARAQDSYLNALLQYLGSLAVNPMEVF